MGEPLPPHRVPYTMNIVSHFASNGKHLREGRGTFTMIEDKIKSSFQRFEDMIRHIEVNLQVNEHFHKDRQTHKQPHIKKSAQIDDNDLRSASDVEQDTMGAGKLAPYIFRVSMSLKSHKTIVLANNEKHAQPTLTEALDHMVDVMKSSLREEKEKFIQYWRKEKSVEDIAEADLIVEEAEQAADGKMERLYK